MRKATILPAAGGLAAALALAAFLPAAEPAGPTRPDKPAAAPAAVTDAAPGLDAAADLDDPAFDRYVDLTAAGRAWKAMDAAALADAALQLAEGERVLMRTHKSGVTAAELLGLAARLAADGRDKATLDRLEKAADARGDRAVAGRVAAARRLAEASRGAEPALTLPVETTTPEEFAALRSLLGDIRAARLAGEADKLRAIEQELPDVPGLAPERRDYFKNLIKEARDSMPAADGDGAKLARTLDKLAAADRGWGVGDLNILNPDSGINKSAVNWDQQRLDQMSIAPRRGRDYTEIYVQNSTGRRIAVALRINPYQAPVNGTTSTLSGAGGGGGSAFQTYAWYQMAPGDRFHIADTADIYVYFYAEGGGTVWRGNHNVTVYDNGKPRNLGMRTMMVNAPQATEWTINIK